MVDLSKVAILCIHRDKISKIDKKEGYNYHLDYYLELAKEDNLIKEILDKYSLNVLLENPNLVHLTIDKDLISSKVGSCIIMTIYPNVLSPNTTYFACMPEKVNDFQQQRLEELINIDNAKFLDFLIYNKENRELESMMDREDYQKNNFYILERYINKCNDNLKLTRKNSNNG